MSADLSDSAVRRLLEVARPLADASAPEPERYEVRGELGRGGMGIVLDAWDRELGRPVALKVLARSAVGSDQARARFLREARAAARLVHPHIASVYDATPDAIAMQRVEGATLAEAPPREPRALAALLRDAALAIHYAHGEGIVHRDLKPANLMVQPGERPHVFVMDFGLAKERSLDAALSVSGGVVGTPAFMAPEQAAGRTREIGPATDVYGLGATAYACLGGRAPFAPDGAQGPASDAGAGGDLYRLLVRVVEEEPRPLRELAPRVDPDLARIVAKAMAKEPAQRYASALALASDLDRWLRGEPIEARPPSVLYRLRRFVARRQGALVAAGAAGLLSFLVALPFLLRAHERRAAAEEERETARSVLELQRRVDRALDDARATLAAGSGYERGAHALLQAAIDDCVAFLGDHEVALARFSLGRLLAAQGRWEEALEAFDRSAPVLEGTLYLAQERGLALAALAREHQSLLGEPPDPRLETWRRRGAADLERALSEPAPSTTPERLYSEAQLAWLQGASERAIALLREVLEMDRGHLGAHLTLARLYLLAGRDELALRHSIEATDLLRGAGRTALPSGPPPADAARARLERELVSVGGLSELLVDFDLLLQHEPSDAHAYGMRGQVEVREAQRALERGEGLVARQTLELAVRQFGAVLTLAPDHPAALLARGAARVQLARLALEGEGSERPGLLLDAALEDYDRAVLVRPEWACARYDRALGRALQAELLRRALRGEEARAALEGARDDARAALRLAGADHPWRERFAALVPALSAG